MPLAAICSFRLGLHDGVSVVARSWQKVLAGLGWQVRTVAGEGPVDRLVEGLGRGTDQPPDPDDLEDALAGADVVVVENLCTIPLNLPAARAVARALAGRPAVLHHHDPAWQRPHLAHLTELPPTDPAWAHVTINQLTQRQLADRGITARTIYNAFDVDEPSGDRAGTRTRLDVGPGERLVVHPVRAIPRKDVPAAVRLAESVGGTYWLVGPAEDDYARELHRVLSAASCRVLHRPSPGSMADAYAAADLIAFPSTWEGFGNPPIEAAIHRRLVAVGPYPVGREVRELGFHWLDSADPHGVAAALSHPDRALLDHNRALARKHFSLERLADDLRVLLADLGFGEQDEEGE